MGRPVTVVVGPLASASATKISLSQKAAVSGTNYLVLNGAAGSFGATNVCASQTPGGAGALTLNGTLAHSNGYVIPTQGYIAGTIVASGTAAAYLPYPQRIYITGGSNESGKTFTVVGYVFPLDGVGGPVAVTETITGPNASTVSSRNLYSVIISITVSAGTAGAITVGSYGTATLDVCRQVIITSAGDDSANTFTITGTDWNGTPISEALLGANAGVATSVNGYLTITSITSSAAVASTLTVGTNTVAYSPWVRFDDYAANAQTTLAAIVSGTVNYDVQTSMDDCNDTASAVYKNPAGMNWLSSLDTNVVGATASKSSYFTYTPLWARVKLNSGTGTVTTTFRQSYLG